MLRAFLISKKINAQVPIIMFSVLFVLYIQDNLIYPIEKLITNSPVIDYVSLMYLPHGVKIVLFFIYRHISIFPVFIATYLYGFTIDFNIIHLLGSFIGIFGIFVAFFFCSFLLKNETIRSQKYLLWRLLVVVTIFSALLNAILQSMLVSYVFKDFNLNLLFLFGDIMGSITIILLLLSFRGILLRLLINEK
ncbi:hypothetical protein OBA40_03615 [Alphaproteobacteria bacterium]|nr:hypothetical protein [Alphaproteobacteria bacterium]